MSASATTINFRVETGLGAHGLAQNILAYAWSLGLDADVRSARSGLLLRNHWLRVSGPHDLVQQVCSYVRSLDTDADA